MHGVSRYPERIAGPGGEAIVADSEVNFSFEHVKPLIDKSVDVGDRA